MRSVRQSMINPWNLGGICNIFIIFIATCLKSSEILWDIRCVYMKFPLTNHPHSHREWWNGCGLEWFAFFVQAKLVLGAQLAVHEQVDSKIGFWCLEQTKSIEKGEKVTRVFSVLFSFLLFFFLFFSFSSSYSFSSSRYRPNIDTAEQSVAFAFFSYSLSLVTANQNSSNPWRFFFVDFTSTKILFYPQRSRLFLSCPRIGSR